MANYSQCNWGKCVQNPICRRYIEEYNENVMRFENLCDQDNNWKWFYGDRSNMIKVELLEDKEVINKGEEAVHNEKKDDA